MQRRLAQGVGMRLAGACRAWLGYPTPDVGGVDGCGLRSAEQGRAPHEPCKPPWQPAQRAETQCPKVSTAVP